MNANKAAIRPTQLTPHPVSPRPQLKAIDRCDRCGAQAYVQFILFASASELKFCLHHSMTVKAKMDELTAAGQVQIGIDDRPFLLATS